MRSKGTTLITLGLVLIISALFLTGYNMLDAFRAKQSAQQAVNFLDSHLSTEAVRKETPDAYKPDEADALEIIPDYILNPKMDMPTEAINGVDYIGILMIPSLGLELPVVSQWSYSDLKTAPCRYSGSAYLDNLIICGHNYTSHFGNLKVLQPGDEVVFEDLDGNTFQYRLIEKETLQSTALEEMACGSWDLTLFTCTIGGQNRVTLRFEKGEN